MWAGWTQPGGYWASPGTILPSLKGVQRGQVPATPEKKGHDQRVRGPDFGSIAVETKENVYKKKTKQNKKKKKKMVKAPLHHCFFLSSLFDSLCPLLPFPNPNIILGGKLMLAFELDLGSK